MQKQVSKQSLAVLALSILLAISMALTATFAAFSATKSATGTISFTSAGYTIEMTGVENPEATDEWTFKGKLAADGTITLDTAATVTFTNVVTGVAMHYSVTISTDKAGITLGETTSVKSSTTEATETVVLSTLLAEKATITADYDYSAITLSVSIKVGSTAAEV